MDIMVKIMQEAIEEMKKDVPEDVCKDIEELSDLEAWLVMKLHTVEEVDLGAVNRINELKRKLYHKKADEPAKSESFDFGEAIRRMKNGARVARKGWNGKGMFVMHCGVEGEKYTLDDGTEVIRRDYLYMKAADDTVVPWVASQTDILAEDWYEVPKVKKEAEKDA